VTEKTVQVDFVTVFREQFAYVWGVLRRLGVHENDVEDLTHEVFLNVYRKFSELDPARPLRPWLFAFAYRVASADRRKARHRREVITADAVAADPTMSADAQLVSNEERSLLLRALDQLDLERRAVLVLHEWDGEPIPEVSRALGIPLNTAYSRLRLARQDLTSAVKRLKGRDG
jgi:RNA polymerase sigma-70 factor (ECF subfamily)